MVLRLAPGHLGALKGMGFVCFQQGRFARGGASISPQRGGARRRRRAGRRARWRTCATARREMARASPRDPRAGCRRRHGARSAVPLRRRARATRSRPRCCSIATGSCSPGAYVACGRPRRGAGGRRGAERRDRRGASRDAPPRARRVDVDRVRDRGRGRRDDAVDRTTDCSCWPTSRATPLGLVRRLLDRCAERRAWLAGRAVDERDALRDDPRRRSPGSAA